VLKLYVVIFCLQGGLKVSEWKWMLGGFLEGDLCSGMRLTRFTIEACFTSLHFRFSY
jgi:hypothetical protein